MTETKAYDNFPVRIVILTNLVSVSTYAIGFLIILRLGWIAAVLYLGFILAFEYRLISKHCINCYYWGKICGFGKGMISSYLFSKGDPSKFCDKKITWKDLVPDMLIMLIPLITGIVFLVIRFNVFLLTAVVLLIASATMGNSYIRGSLTCKFCKQRESGCPAEKLFSKTDKADS